jgi:hypothetical protein
MTFKIGTIFFYSNLINLFFILTYFIKRAMCVNPFRCIYKDIDDSNFKHIYDYKSSKFVITVKMKIVHLIIT